MTLKGETLIKIRVLYKGQGAGRQAARPVGKLLVQGHKNSDYDAGGRALCIRSGLRTAARSREDTRCPAIYDSGTNVVVYSRCFINNDRSMLVTAASGGHSFLLRHVRRNIASFFRLVQSPLIITQSVSARHAPRSKAAFGGSASIKLVMAHEITM